MQSVEGSHSFEPRSTHTHTHTHTLQGYDPQNVLSERTTKDGTTIIKFRDGGACLHGAHVHGSCVHV